MPVRASATLNGSEWALTGFFFKEDLVNIVTDHTMTWRDYIYATFLFGWIVPAFASSILAFINPLAAAASAAVSLGMILSLGKL